MSHLLVALTFGLVTTSASVAAPAELPRRTISVTADFGPTIGSTAANVLYSGQQHLGDDDRKRRRKRRLEQRKRRKKRLEAQKKRRVERRERRKKRAAKRKARREREERRERWQQQQQQQQPHLDHSAAWSYVSHPLRKQQRM